MGKSVLDSNLAIYAEQWVVMVSMTKYSGFIVIFNGYWTDENGYILNCSQSHCVEIKMA